MLALAGAVAFIVALVVFVNRQTASSGLPAPTLRPAAIAEQNRETRALERQVQAPHVVTVRAGQSPRAAVTAAVLASMRRQIRAEPALGPLMRFASGCTRSASAAGASPTRLPFRCTVEAGNVKYPFLGVVDTGGRRVTYCERAVSSIPVPVSRRCT